MHLYLLILGIVVIAASMWCCYTEGFQVAPAQASTNFWAISNKVDANDAPTLKALSRVSGPDPNDPKDTMPLTFSKYISIYAMAKYNSDLSGARTALLNNYNQLQTEMSTNLYDQSQKAAWGADPINKSCVKLDTLRAVFIGEYSNIINSIQDLSGSAVLAGKMRDENLAYQQLLVSQCQGNSLSPACINLANQEGPVFSLMAKYENANNTIFAAQIDISNNLQTINDTYSVLGCTNPNQFFKGSSATYWIANNTKYAVGSTTCSPAINANMSGTAPGPNIIADDFLAKIPTGPSFTCNMVGSAELKINDETTGSVDTTVLLSKLQTLSPYYLSPDTLQHITSSVMSSSEATGLVMTTSDIIIDITNVINNIKLLTGTT
jgi:hypothetical protein